MPRRGRPGHGYESHSYESHGCEETAPGAGPGAQRFHLMLQPMLGF